MIKGLSIAIGLMFGALFSKDPTVHAVYSVDSNMLAVQIEEGELVRVPQEEFNPSEHYIYERHWDGYKVLYFDENDDIRFGYRSAHTHDGNHRYNVAHPYGSDTYLRNKEYTQGSVLSGNTSLEMFRLAKPDGNILTPVSIHQKTKIIRMPKENNFITPVRHTFYLEFAEDLQDGSLYELQYLGLNTTTLIFDYNRDLKHQWSEAVHINHLGFFPNSGFKRGYLSLWKGGLAFGNSSQGNAGQEYSMTTFEILESTSRNSVYTGSIVLGYDADKKEYVAGQNDFQENHVNADVYYMDFEDFKTPGEYVLYVPGLGCSYPFTIGEDLFEGPFKTSMKGLLAHRSGIDLTTKVPGLGYDRPRPMHPDDGVKVFSMTRTLLEGTYKNVSTDLEEKLGVLKTDDKTVDYDITLLTELQEAWGGYQDAGDWDRRYIHLYGTYRLLELYEMFPDYFKNLSLLLPDDEKNDSIPDLLNECLWNIDFYRRLQESEGGVRGGVESTEHPSLGETSWQETLLLGAYAPDPVGNNLYAATAAKAARLIYEFDVNRSNELKDSAILAYNWAETNGNQALDEANARYLADNPGVSSKRAGWESSWSKNKVKALLSLLHLTEDLSFHDDLMNTEFDDNISGYGEDTLFSYCLLPSHLSDAQLKTQAEEQILTLAQKSIDYAKFNAFNIANIVPYKPLVGPNTYHSLPETGASALLPKAYYLTGDSYYLDSAISAMQFSLGANPSNMCYTTGVGHDYPIAVLHVDSRETAQPAPEGITIYGSFHSHFDQHKWTWGLSNLIPTYDTWPATEFYMGHDGWPGMNEYTVGEIMRTIYYWGFMAAQTNSDLLKNSTQREIVYATMDAREGVDPTATISALKGNIFIKMPLVEVDENAESIILKIHVATWQDGNPFDITVHEVEHSDWTGNEIENYNLPSVGPLVDSIPFTYESERFFCLDVTDYVKRLLGEDEVEASFMVSSTADETMWPHMRFIENEINIPHLEVTTRKDVAINLAPIANAGPDQDVNLGDSVSLDGGASSDPDKGPSALTYQWVQIGGPIVSIHDQSSAVASFSATQADTYLFELTVSDGEWDDTDTIKIKVLESSGAFQEINGEVVMEAENSISIGQVDFNGDAWQVGNNDPDSVGDYVQAVSNNGSNAKRWSDEGCDLNFNINFTQTGDYYIFIRYKTDETGWADNSYHYGLDGNVVRENESLWVSNSWIWRRGSTRVQINSTGTQTLTIRKREDGLKIDRIVLSTSSSIPTGDGPGESPLVGGSVNSAPIADAGIDQNVDVDTIVYLDASNSSDPDNSPNALSFEWSQKSGPAIVALNDASTVKASFIPTLIGTYEFNVQVNDGADSTEDTVTIVVNNVPSNNLLSNGNFASGLTDWHIVNYAEVSASVSASNGELEVDISSPSAIAWHLQVYQSFNFQAGVTYRLTFDARTLNSQTVSFIADKNGSPWTRYMHEEIVLSNNTQSYSITWTQTIDDHVKIGMYMGDNAVDTYYFDNFVLSEVSSGPLAFQEVNGEVVMEAENAMVIGQIDAQGDQWNIETGDGTSVGGYVEAGPNNGDNARNWDDNGSEINFDINFSNPGDYHVFIRYKADNWSDDSYHYGLGGDLVRENEALGASSSWKWDRGTVPLSIDQAGVKTFTIRKREDGLKIDRIVLSKNKVTLTGNGPLESAIE